MREVCARWMWWFTKTEDRRKRCVYKRINAAEEKEIEKRRLQKRKLDALKKTCQPVFLKRKKVKGREVFQRLEIEIEIGMKNERGDGRSWAENEIEWDGN